jgi:hypothetical protein
VSALPVRGTVSAPPPGTRKGFVIKTAVLSNKINVGRWLDGSDPIGTFSLYKGSAYVVTKNIASELPLFRRIDP